MQKGYWIELSTDAVNNLIKSGYKVRHITSVTIPQSTRVDDLLICHVVEVVEIPMPVLSSEHIYQED